MSRIRQDPFEQPKKHIRKERRSNIFLLSAGIFFLVLTSLAAFSDLRALIPALPAAALLLFAIRCIVKNDRLLKQIASIETIKSNEVMLSRPKITFLACPRRSYASIPQYYGMTVTDCRKNKYYYFFDECVTYDKAYFQYIREKCARVISIQCYENTAIIRTIENDPRFLRIQYESMFK